MRAQTTAIQILNFKRHAWELRLSPPPSVPSPHTVSSLLIRCSHLVVRPSSAHMCKQPLEIA